MVGSGVHHGICDQVAWSRVPPRAVPLSTGDSHLSRGLRFSAVMDNQLRSGGAGPRSVRLPDGKRRRASRWSSPGRARGARRPAPPSWTRSLAARVGLRSLPCWSRNSEALSVFHPPLLHVIMKPVARRSGTLPLAWAELFGVSGSTGFYVLHQGDGLHNTACQARIMSCRLVTAMLPMRSMSNSGTLPRTAQDWIVHAPRDSRRCSRYPRPC